MLAAGRDAPRHLLPTKRKTIMSALIREIDPMYAIDVDTPQLRTLSYRRISQPSISTRSRTSAGSVTSRVPIRAISQSTNALIRYVNDALLLSSLSFIPIMCKLSADSGPDSASLPLSPPQLHVQTRLSLGELEAPSSTLWSLFQASRGG
jgi:hypothetical protein